MATFFNRQSIARRGLLRNVILIIPGAAAHFIIHSSLLKNRLLQTILDRTDIIYMVVIVIMILNSLLLMFLDAYSHTEKSKNRPLKALVQAIQVVMVFIGIIICVAVLFDKSPKVLLTGLGASAAVLMLVFKDSILGFVAGVQLMQNNMVQIGDWIQMPDGSANGTVEEITLNTVKVRNWDNTLSMIPPYTLVSSTFKNWRGMQESGGRRADKMIYIDVNSLEECSQEMVDDMVKSFPLLMGKLQGAVMTDRLTNAQVYRTYIFAYLKTHPYVNPDLDIIVTQKEATPYGMPIEVYFFTREKDWALYEKQQSDIFDHLMSIAPEFGLRLYQRP